jgi:hypothetical protein
MSLLGRHNRGQYKDGAHNDGAPVIRDYDDVYSFLVKNPDEVSTEDAIALHIFGISFRKAIKNDELKKGRQLTDSEITQLIDARYGASQGEKLPLILKQAQEKGEDTVAKVASKAAIGEKPKIRTIAWHGVLGNGSFVLAIIALFAGVKLFGFWLDHDIVGNTLSFLHLRDSGSPLPVDSSLKTAIEGLQQQIADLKKQPAPSAPPPVDSSLKTAIEDLQKQIADLKKQPAPSSPPPVDSSLKTAIERLQQQIADLKKQSVATPLAPHHQKPPAHHRHHHHHRPR